MTAKYLLLATLSFQASTMALADARLINAVKNQDVDAVRALLQEGVDVNSPEPDGATALHWAAYGGDVEMAKILIASGADVSAANELGVQPIRLASIDANPEMVETLLEAGANPNAACCEGETALMTASRTGNAEVVRLLLHAGADPDAQEQTQRQTALMWAAAEDHVGAVERLLEHEADRTITSGEGFTAMVYAVRAGSTDVVRRFLDAGVDPNVEAAPDGSNDAPDGKMDLLNLAIYNGHFETAAALIAGGADVNALSSAGTPLMNLLQIRRQNYCETPCVEPTGNVDSFELVQMLLDHGADADPEPFDAGGVRGFGGRLPELAANAAAAQAAQEVRRNALANRDYYAYAKAVSNDDGLAALGLAPQQDIFVPPPDADLSGDEVTPFMFAARTADVEVMRLLAEHGAITVRRTGNGKTGLMLAAGIDYDRGMSPGTNRESFEAVKMLYEWGDTDVNAKDAIGNTALHAAAQRGAQDVIRFLVEKGADLNVENLVGWTPLDIARGYKDFPGVGRRVMRNIVTQPDVVALIEELLEEQGVTTAAQ